MVFERKLIDFCIDLQYNLTVPVGQFYSWTVLGLFAPFCGGLGQVVGHVLGSCTLQIEQREREGRFRSSLEFTLFHLAFRLI